MVSLVRPDTNLIATFYEYVYFLLKIPSVKKQNGPGDHQAVLLATNDL